MDAPVVVVVVAGEGAPRCLGVYGTYRGPGAVALASGVSAVVETAAVEGDVEGEGEIPGAGERRGWAVKLSCEVSRWMARPERPMEPAGKRGSRLDMVYNAVSVLLDSE